MTYIHSLIILYIKVNSRSINSSDKLVPQLFRENRQNFITCELYTSLSICLTLFLSNLNCFRLHRLQLVKHIAWVSLTEISNRALVEERSEQDKAKHI